MSMRLMVDAMHCKVGNPIRKLVLIKLADNANDEGRCWPSYQHIADECEVSRSTVKQHIRSLEKSGFLKREFRKNGSVNKSNMFHLSIGREATDMGHDLAEGGQRLPDVGRDLTGHEAESAPGGEAGNASRTSNLFEPVYEPVNEADDPHKNTLRAMTQTEKSAQRVAEYLHKRLLEEVPEAETLDPQKWNKDIELAIRLDGRTETQLIEIIDWMHHGDRFWVGNIKSGKKLRDKYLTMLQQKRRPKAGSVVRRKPGEFPSDRVIQGELVTGAPF